MNFRDIGLKPGLLKGVLEAGYENTTDIQEKVIPYALEGKNIVGQSQTGTGKTAAFLLPVLNKIDTNLMETQALILAPTRELVVQIYDEIYKLTKYYRVPAATLFGGVSQVNQTVEVNRKPRIIIATPGRLWDFVEQKIIDLRTVKYFVVDEVDRMLDMGFSPIIQKIWAKTSRIKQTYSFSATLNNEILNIVKEHIPEYELIKMGGEMVVDKIDHSYITVETKDKFINLTKLLGINKTKKIVVFTNTIHNTNIIYEKLESEGYKVGILNGDLKQSKRLTTLDAFTKGKIKILITTDVAARGLNMDNIGLVINFDIPKDIENYIHRIGRTARAGAEGSAIMFVTSREFSKISEIESKFNIKIAISDFKQMIDKDGIYSKIPLDIAGTISVNSTLEKKGYKTGRDGISGKRSSSRDEGKRKTGEKKYGEKKSFGNKSDGDKSAVRSFKYEKRFSDRVGEGRKTGEKRFGKRNSEEKSFDSPKSYSRGNSGERRFEDRGVSDRDSFRKTGEKRFGSRVSSEREYDTEKSFRGNKGERKFEDKKPSNSRYGEKSFEKNNKGREFGERKFGDTRDHSERVFTKKSYGAARFTDRENTTTGFSDKPPRGGMAGKKSSRPSSKGKPFTKK